ncbi:MAG TPA: YbhN family protein [Actinomycetes bacterium]|nr:YbhN family protein [Actinomycetes bacterium]
MSGTRPTRGQLIQGAISIVVVVGIFSFALPKLADFSEVWRTVRAMTGLEVGVLAVVAAINLLTYLPVNMAVLPSLRPGEAFVSNNASTAVANTLPAGGALGVGVNFAMYRSWGFDNASITLALLVSGILNTFVKLAMPVVALALLVILGEASTALAAAAAFGVAVLAVALGLFAGILSSDRLADRIGTWLGRVATVSRRWVRRPPVANLGARAVQFRHQTIGLLRSRGWYAAAATVVSHVTLFLVLLVALRQVGVSDDEVGWTQVLAAFAFGRLLTAVPITPGGLGVIELGYVAALSVGVDAATRAQIVAAVFVFRALTFLPPILIGAACYVFWRRRSSWRHPVGSRPSAKPEPITSSG